MTATMHRTPAWPVVLLALALGVGPALHVSPAPAAPLDAGGGG